MRIVHVRIIGRWARKDGVDTAVRGFRQQRRAVRPHHEPPAAIRGSHDHGWQISLVRELCGQGHRLHLLGESKNENEKSDDEIDGKIIVY